MPSIINTAKPKIINAPAIMVDVAGKISVARKNQIAPKIIKNKGRKSEGRDITTLRKGFRRPVLLGASAMQARYKNAILCVIMQRLAQQKDRLNSGKPKSNISIYPVPDGLLNHQALPVLPKPPSPRSLAANSSTTLNAAWTTGTITICAIRSIGSMVNASLPRFHKETFNSP